MTRKPRTQHHHPHLTPKQRQNQRQTNSGFLRAHLDGRYAQGNHLRLAAALIASLQQAQCAT